MRLESSDLIFDEVNGLWQGTGFAPDPTRILLAGPPNFFDDPQNARRLVSFAMSASHEIARASVFADASAYASDIREGGGMILDTIHICPWDDIRIWFALAKSNERMVGVRVVGSKPNDVYLG